MIEGHAIPLVSPAVEAEVARADVWTRVVGAAIFTGAIVLCAANGYFILAHPQGCRWLTVPLIGVLLVLGFINWRYQLLLFVFLAPLLYWLPVMDDGIRLRLARMMFPFVLAFWGMRLVSPSAQALPSTRLRRPLELYIGLVLLSAVLTLWRYYPLLNWDTIVMTAHELVEANRANFWAYFRPEFCIARETVVYVTGPLFLLLLLHSADAALLSRLRTTLLCSVAVAASVALWQKMSGAKSLALSVWGREGLQRVHGTLGDANTFGAYLALLLPVFAIEVALRWWPSPSPATADPGRDRHRLWALRVATLVSAVLVILAIVWAASRAAWVGTLFAAALLARARWASVAALLNPFRRRLRLCAVLVAIGLAVTLVTYSGFRPRPFKEWHSPADALLALFSAQGIRAELRGRWTWWDPALRMGIRLPLTGVGVGNYRFFAGPYWPGPQLFGILGDPHNYYLKPLSELGVIGLGLFLWICRSVWLTWRAPSHRNRRRDLQHLAAGAGLLALAIDMVFQHALVQSEMQVITAAVIALAVLDETGRAHLPARDTNSKWLSVLVVAVLGIAVLWAGRYRAAEVYDAAPASLPKWGATPDGSAVYLRGKSGLNAVVDQELDRALVLVTARAQKVGDQWPRLMLRANGDYLGEWTIDSATTKVFKRTVFTAPGPTHFQLQLLGYYRDPKTGADRSVHVEGFKVVGGHTASHLATHDP